MSDSIYDMIDHFMDERPRFPVDEVWRFIQSLYCSYDIEPYVQYRSETITKALFEKLPKRVTDGIFLSSIHEVLPLTVAQDILSPAKVHFQVDDDDNDGSFMLCRVIYECLNEMNIYADKSNYSGGWKMFSTKNEARQDALYMMVSLTDIGERVYARIRELLLANGIDCIYTIYSCRDGMYFYYPLNQWHPSKGLGDNWDMTLYYKATDQLIKYAQGKGYM